MSKSKESKDDDYEFVSVEILDKAVGNYHLFTIFKYNYLELLLIFSSKVFCDSNEFQNKKSDFENKHAISFYAAAESKTPEMDQDVILYSIFQEYQALIDDLFTRFADDNNTTTYIFFEVFYI